MRLSFIQKIEEKMGSYLCEPLQHRPLTPWEVIKKNARIINMAGRYFSIAG